MSQPIEFSTIRRHGKKFSTPFFYCYWKSYPSQQPRLGITISKRQIRFAYRRNQIKRIIRDWFRTNQYDLPQGDFVFIVTRRTLNANPDEIRSTLAHFYQKLKKHCKTT